MKQNVIQRCNKSKNIHSNVVAYTGKESINKMRSEPEEEEIMKKREVDWINVNWGTF